jgi:hypothetical protein
MMHQKSLPFCNKIHSNEVLLSAKWSATAWPKRFFNHVLRGEIDPPLRLLAEYHSCWLLLAFTSQTLLGFFSNRTHSVSKTNWNCQCRSLFQSQECYRMVAIISYIVKFLLLPLKQVFNTFYGKVKLSL